MADITNAQVVKFSNERARSISDNFTHAYYSLLAYQADYAAQNIAAAMASNATGDVIIDGSATDGRSIITKGHLVNLNAAITQLKTALDTTSVPGVGTTAVAILNGIQVNGSTR